MSIIEGSTVIGIIYIQTTHIVISILFRLTPSISNFLTYGKLDLCSGETRQEGGAQCNRLLGTRGLYIHNACYTVYVLSVFLCSLFAFGMDYKHLVYIPF